jgi:DNA-binding transcriptional MocR family regulator
MADDALIDWEASYAGRAEKMRASEIRELLKLIGQPDILSFAGGIPDPALFPMEAIRDAYSTILATPQSGPPSLQYSVSEGYLPLRQWIVEHMGRLGVSCDVDNIVITNGSQQGLDFLGKLFLSPGDTALVMAPTYLGALQAFNAYEPRYDILAPEKGNTTPAVYRDAAKAAGGRVAFAYVVPDFSNPTGETLTEEARRRLLDLTAELGVPLIEDAVYEAMRFEGERVPPCLALDLQRCGHIDRSRVVFCGTFSKTIAPGFRVGWICAARDLVQKIVLTKQAGDVHSATINQMVVHEVVKAVYDEQVRKIVATYSKRRDAMLAGLARYMPAGVSWTTPNGGMFVWVTLPTALDGAELLAAALEQERVAFVPGSAFFADGSGKNTIRLSFSLQPEAAVEEGMARLGRLIARRMAARAA